MVLYHYSTSPFHAPGRVLVDVTPTQTHQETHDTLGVVKSSKMMSGALPPERKLRWLVLGGASAKMGTNIETWNDVCFGPTSNNGTDIKFSRLTQKKFSSCCNSIAWSSRTHAGWIGKQELSLPSLASYEWRGLTLSMKTNSSHASG